MKFAEAIEKVLEGKKVKRKGEEVFYKLGKFVLDAFSENGSFCNTHLFSRQDLEADDWEVVE